MENKNMDTAGINQGDNSKEALPDLRVTFAVPYKFEGKEYKEVDLSGIRNASAEDMIAVERYLKQSGAVTTTSPEITMEYVCVFAGRMTEMPMEFFKGLPPKEALKVKNRVIDFFYS